MESIAMRKVGSRLHDGKFGPHRLRYQAQVDETVVALEEGPGALAAEARIVSFSYTVLDQAPPNRPLLFAFNGGPGSASLWLHLGFLGPKRLADADSTTPRQVPPFRLVDNPDSPLDVADIVLIDPPGTGYSRVADEQCAHECYGVDADAKAMLQFVSIWSRTHHREHSPKFLLGESDGGLRAAVMARLAAGGPLETGRVETVALNGIILIGPALMEHGVSPEVRSVAALPSLAAAGHFHGRAGVGTSLTSHVAAARAFAEGPYLSALFRGTRLSGAEVDDLAG